MKLGIKILNMLRSCPIGVHIFRRFLAQVPGVQAAGVFPYSQRLGNSRKSSSFLEVQYYFPRVDPREEDLAIKTRPGQITSG
jgi:hypothetical protein